LADPPPIFRRVGDQVFRATSAAAGPWNEGYCHGGAPSALLASAFEQVATSVPMDLARLTVDLIRPVPVGEALRVDIREIQQGRTVQRLTAELLAAGRILARATALKIRSRGGAAGIPAADPPPGRPMPMPGGFSEQFTILATEGRFGRSGPASAWFRLNVPLVDDVEASPLARAVAAADFGSGIAHELPFDTWSFPSLDLNLFLVRPPVGGWTLLESRWAGADGGRTSCRTLLGDAEGGFGEAGQTVLLEARVRPP
jgi:acyl-coenzyme A thioesterase PaaI-like protein